MLLIAAMHGAERGKKDELLVSTLGGHAIGIFERNIS
jgi:hypothetical protein